jgi:hypothetical protein
MEIGSFTSCSDAVENADKTITPCMDRLDKTFSEHYHNFFAKRSISISIHEYIKSLICVEYITYRHLERPS